MVNVNAKLEGGEPGTYKRVGNAVRLVDYASRPAVVIEWLWPDGSGTSYEVATLARAFKLTWHQSAGARAFRLIKHQSAAIVYLNEQALEAVEQLAMYTQVLGKPEPRCGRCEGKGYGYTRRHGEMEPTPCYCTGYKCCLRCTDSGQVWQGGESTGRYTTCPKCAGDGNLHQVSQQSLCVDCHKVATAGDGPHLFINPLAGSPVYARCEACFDKWIDQLGSEDPGEIELEPALKCHSCGEAIDRDAEFYEYLLGKGATCAKCIAQEVLAGTYSGDTLSHRQCIECGRRIPEGSEVLTEVGPQCQRCRLVGAVFGPQSPPAAPTLEPEQAQVDLKATPTDEDALVLGGEINWPDWQSFDQVHHAIYEQAPATADVQAAVARLEAEGSPITTERAQAFSEYLQSHTPAELVALHPPGGVLEDKGPKKWVCTATVSHEDPEDANTLVVIELRIKGLDTRATLIAAAIPEGLSIAHSWALDQGCTHLELKVTL